MDPIRNQVSFSQRCAFTSKHSQQKTSSSILSRIVACVKKIFTQLSEAIFKKSANRNPNAKEKDPLSGRVENLSTKDQDPTTKKTTLVRENSSLSNVSTLPASPAPYIGKASSLLSNPSTQATPRSPARKKTTPPINKRKAPNASSTKGRPYADVPVQQNPPPISNECRKAIMVLSYPSEAYKDYISTNSIEHQTSAHFFHKNKEIIIEILKISAAITIIDEIIKRKKNGEKYKVEIDFDGCPQFSPVGQLENSVRSYLRDIDASYKTLSPFQKQQRGLVAEKGSSYSEQIDIFNFFGIERPTPNQTTEMFPALIDKLFPINQNSESLRQNPIPTELSDKEWELINGKLKSKKQDLENKAFGSESKKPKAE